MNVLTLIPRSRRLEYAFFVGREQRPRLEARRPLALGDEAALLKALGEILAACAACLAGAPDTVVLRAAYGGGAFAGTVPATDEALAALAELAGEAPMHVPPVLELARAARRLCPQAAVLLTFETAFFVGLPARERAYGIADDRVRRFGYHGLYHRAASQQRLHRREDGLTRTLSLCLEPQPELAAILGNRPVMVTSGATPLEGLPGETTCGELDPTIVLTLARELDWGPEQINDLLTRQSGVRGLVGRTVRLGELLSATQWPADGGALGPEPVEGLPRAARRHPCLREERAGLSNPAGGRGRHRRHGRAGPDRPDRALRRRGSVPRPMACRATRPPARRRQAIPVVHCPTPLSSLLAKEAFLCGSAVPDGHPNRTPIAGCTTSLPSVNRDQWSPCCSSASVEESR